jgi:preprotein translocase subunit SecE
MEEKVTGRSNVQQNYFVMGKIRHYIEETSNELLHKVSWPTWTELQESAGIVAIASVIIALIIFGMDYGFSALMKTLYQVL